MGRTETKWLDSISIVYQISSFRLQMPFLIDSIIVSMHDAYFLFVGGGEKGTSFYPPYGVAFIGTSIKTILLLANNNNGREARNVLGLIEIFYKFRP